MFFFFLDSKEHNLCFVCCFGRTTICCVATMKITDCLRYFAIRFYIFFCSTKERERDARVQYPRNSSFPQSIFHHIWWRYCSLQQIQKIYNRQFPHSFCHSNIFLPQYEWSNDIKQNMHTISMIQPISLINVRYIFWVYMLLAWWRRMDRLAWHAIKE